MITTELQTFGPSSIVRRFVLTYSDLTAAATTQTIDLMSLPQGCIVKTVRIKHTVAFAGGSLSSMTVSVGSSAGSATTFKAAFDCFQAVAATSLVCAPATAQFATYAADTLQCKFTGSHAVNTATAGSVFIDVEMLMEPSLVSTPPTGNSLALGGQL